MDKTPRTLLPADLDAARARVRGLVLRQTGIGEYDLDMLEVDARGPVAKNHDALRKLGVREVRDLPVPARKLLWSCQDAVAELAVREVAQGAEYLEAVARARRTVWTAANAA